MTPWMRATLVIVSFGTMALVAWMVGWSVAVRESPTVAEWAGCHKFAPQPDISPYELAAILSHVSGYGGLKVPVCFRVGAFETLPYSLKRHFQ